MPTRNWPVTICGPLSRKLRIDQCGRSEQLYRDEFLQPLVQGLPATSLFSNVRSYDPYRISDDKIHRQDSVQASGSFHQYSVTKHKSESRISRLLLLLSAPKKKIQYIINTACERYIENAMKHRFHSQNSFAVFTRIFCNIIFHKKL